MTAPIVEVKQGKLRGAIRDNIAGGTYISFTGVPFAEPPVGSLRFKEPQPLKSWEGVKDALEESKASAQVENPTNVRSGEEDCLYLNVATTSLTEKRPVMVWIHGGAFKRSSNTYKKYSPDYLLQKDIVFVGVNYRLGVLGFLNMDHEECAGNQGLKDQIAALKWVRENIKVFGGDPDNVTIFGESAGSAAVHSLCISPQAKGLFHKAIAQSGVVSNPWAHVSSNKQYGYSLAKALGKECSNPLEVIEFLRTIPVFDVIEMYEKLNIEENLDLILNFVPTVDSKSSNPVLPCSIRELEKNGVSVPLLIGYNSHEGILRFAGSTPDLFKKVNDNFEQTVADILRIDDTKKISKLAKAVRELYFGKDEITEKKTDEMVQFYGDIYFVNNILGVADIQMQKLSPTYLYKYSYRSDAPGIKERFNVKIEGTCHAEELGALFYSEMRFGKLKEGTRDHRTMKRLTTMWTNFAKNGNPTPELNELIPVVWKPLEKNRKNYLEINDNLTLGENPDDRIWRVWKPLLESI